MLLSSFAIALIRALHDPTALRRVALLPQPACLCAVPVPSPIPLQSRIHVTSGSKELDAILGGGFETGE